MMIVEKDNLSHKL